MSSVFLGKAGLKRLYFTGPSDMIYIKLLRPTSRPKGRHEAGNFSPKDAERQRHIVLNEQPVAAVPHFFSLASWREAII
jgi:hypothetical protein